MPSDSKQLYLSHFSFFLAPLVLGLLLTAPVQPAFNDAGDENSDAINVRIYEDFKVNPEIEDNCDLRVMRAYSMYGDAASLSEPNQVFPSIKQNCCGPRDQENIKAIWRRASSHIVKNQRFFLYLAKGMLSSARDFINIAINAVIIYDRVHGKKYSFDSVKKEYPGLQFFQGDLVWHTKNYKVLVNEELVKFAREMDSQMDRKRLHIMYDNFNQAAEFMMNVRRSFYGMICSIEGQQACSRKGFLKRVFYFNDIYYGTPFCDAMINHHFKYFYDYHYFLKRLMRFVDHLPYFLQVTDDFQQGNDSVLNKSAPSAGNSGGSDIERKGVTLPNGHFLYGSPAYDHFKEHYQNESLGLLDRLSLQACSQYSNFTACEFYCQEFSIAKHNDYFDGNPELMLRTFRVMMAVRENLKGFNENDFNLDYVKLENSIDDLKEKYYPYIYASTMPNDVEFNEQGNDFSELVGYNPLEVSANCTLDLTFKSAGSLASLFMLVLVLLFNKN